MCEVYETAHKSIRAAFAEHDDLPDYSQIFRWEKIHPEFRDRLSRAREVRAHILAESALDVADDDSHDTLTKSGRDGETYESANSEWIARSRLRFEARKWHSGNLNPSAFGEKRSVNLGGQPGNPLKTEAVSVLVDPDSLPDEDRAAIMRILHRNLQGKS